MPHFAAKRTHADPQRMRASAMACLARPLSEAMGQDDFMKILDDWHAKDDPDDRCGLNEDDLLAVAIFQQSPEAFHAWLSAGETINGDTLLALLSVDHAPGNPNAVYGCAHCVHALMTPALQPWRSVIFAHANRSSALLVAKDFIEKGLIAPTTPIPSRADDEASWLWSWEPHVHNELDATLPLHRCLRMGRFDLAELLWKDYSEDILVDPHGTSLLSVIESYLDLHSHHKYASMVAWTQKAEVWRDRLKSLDEGADLDLSTPLIDGSIETSVKDVAPRRL